MQKVLTFFTMQPTLTCSADGWQAENFKGRCIYDTAAAALEDGWKLLAPPQKIEDDVYPWQWWLVKE